MINNGSANPSIQNDDKCTVVGGVHQGKAGVVEDLHESSRGNWTLTVRQPNGDRFKTLAKNVQAQTA